MIYVFSKRKSLENLRKEYPTAEIIDVTSSSNSEWSKLSPFYPHGGIPVPNSEGYFATCVEAIWQGLKIFSTVDIDISLFTNATMRNLKRTVRKFGLPLGHRFGVKSNVILSYIDARKMIYIPSYNWMLRNKAMGLVDKIADIAAKRDVVLLDYDTNSDVENPNKPLSHAYLLKMFIEINYSLSTKVQTTPSLFDYE